MRPRFGFGSLLALVLVSPGVARAEEVSFFQQLLGELVTSVHPLRRDVTVSVGGLKQGRLQQVTLECRDSNARVLASLQAGEVEVLQLDLQTMQVSLRIKTGKFALGDTTGQFEDRVLWAPLFPHRRPPAHWRPSVYAQGGGGIEPNEPLQSVAAAEPCHLAGAHGNRI
jgi:hypothetical protein